MTGTDAIGPRSARTRSYVLAAALVAALGLLSLFVARAEAVPLSGSANPLPGSNFEGGDGNQTAGALRTDWQNAGGVNHSPDPNANDDIFAGGAEGKESNPGNWNFDTHDGGSTPGKNNILDAYSLNDPVSNDVFLHLAFTRGDDTGTTYMAFELNQRAELWNNGKADIPCRTTGDIIVSYQVSGNDPDVILQKWTSTTTDAATGCATTGSLTDFAAFTDNVDAQGAVNDVAIQNYLPSSFDWGVTNTIPANLFGEASLNLTTLLKGALGTPCFSFGSIWMHTRASTSDQSNLDDYIAPRPLLVRNCTATGTKFHDLNANGVEDEGEPGLAGFRIWADYDNDGVRDAGEPFDDTDANGDYSIANVEDPSGTYSLREQLTPPATGTGGWICSAPATTGDNGDFPCSHNGIDGATTPNASGKDFGNYKQAVVKVEKQTVPDGATGSFAFASTIPGKASFSLSDGQVNETTVNPGVYTATETVHPDFSLTDITCSGETIAPNSSDAGAVATFNAQSGETITCVFTNTRKTGQLTVRKVLDPATDAGKFDLRIGDEVVVDDGGHLAEGTRTLATGTGYTVSELDGAGTSLAKYDSAIVCKDGADTVASGSGTSLSDVPVVEGHNVVCTFTNTRRKGSITVVKDLFPSDDAGRFDLRVDGDVVKAAAGDGDSGSKDVAPGDYTVSELGANGTDLAKYDKSVACTRNGQAAESGAGASLGGVTVDSNDVVVCTITNTRRGGELTVIKDLAPDDDPGTFDLRIDADVVKADASDGDSGSKSVAPGDYDVSELGAGGTSLAKYDSSVSCDNGQSGEGSALADVHVDSNESVTCTITNTRRKGSITVVKDLKPSDDEGRFDLQVDDDVVKAAAGDGDQGSKDVAPGEYTVSELGANGTDLSKYDKSIACTRNGQAAVGGGGASLGGVTVDSNDVVVCTITNTRRQASITVVKDLTPSDDTGTFDLKVGDDVLKAGAGDGDSGTKNVAPGTYTVSELGANGTDLTQYARSIACVKNGQPGPSGQGSSLGGVEVDSNDAVVCTITNERSKGTIEVVKDLFPSDDEGTFDLKVDGTVVKAGASDGQGGSTNVAPGDYTVSELGANGTDLSKYDKSVACRRNGQAAESGAGASLGGVTVDSNDVVVCTITNTRRQASITVVKDLTPSDDTGTFDLKVGDDVVKAGAGDGDSGTKNVAPGTYTVSEQGAEGTSLDDYDSSVACEKNDQAYKDGSGTSLGGIAVDSNDVVVCTIANTRLGTVEVEKQTHPATEDSFHFTADLPGGGFDLQDDGVKTVQHVLPGTYTVTEDDPEPAYDLTDLACDDGESGTPSTTSEGDRTATIEVDPGETVRCVFTNTKRGNAVVVKTEGGSAPEAGRVWTFTLSGGPDGVELEQQTDGDGGSEGVVFAGLKPGAYTLCEVDMPAGWHSSLEQAPGRVITVDEETGAIASVCVAITIEEGDVENVAVDNVRPDIEVDKLVRLLPGGTFAKTAFAHVGDKVEYRFEVTNPGVGAFVSVEFSDPRCDAGSLSGPTGDAGVAGELEKGEQWVYLCTHVVTAQDPDPLPNTATVKGTDKYGNTDTDESSAAVDVIHPAIDIEKTGPATATVGAALAYTLTVTNPGDVPFAAQDVAVTDPKCEAPPAGPNTGGDVTPSRLDPGDTWTYTCTAQTAGQPAGSFVNTATVTTKDFLGKTVTDTDDFPTVLEAQAVLPAQIIPGSSRLSGPSGCVRKPFTAVVRGTRIARVTFFRDGKRIKTMTAKPGQRKFVLRIKPSRAPGVHRITARVQFEAGSGTKARTLRLSYQRCVRQVVRPRFTG